MRNIHQLMQEIIELTTEIQTQYPELNKFLDEAPLFLDNSQGKDISPSDLENYLNTLKEQLQDRIKTQAQTLNQSALPVKNTHENS